MFSLRIVFLLLALLSGGLAHASHPFDNAPRASDEELDRMRGGFVVNWNGMDFLMPFSIDGIERLTQINGQIYINGALLSPRVNPQALMPLVQVGQVSVNVPTPAPAIEAPGLAVFDGPLPAGSTDVPVDANVGPDDAVTAGAPALGQTISGADADSLTSLPTTQTTQASSDPDTPSSPPTSTSTSAANTQVTTNGSMIIVQSGAANSIVLPSGASLDSLNSIIQNSVNDQVIRNITTMNITIQAQLLAAQARLNAVLNQSGLR